MRTLVLSMLAPLLANIANAQTPVFIPSTLETETSSLEFHATFPGNRDDYYASQRVDARRGFLDYFSEDCYTRKNRNSLVRLKANVGENPGTAVETHVENAFRCKSRWQAYANEVVYIPAYSQGRFVEGLYEEYYWNGVARVSAVVRRR